MFQTLSAGSITGTPAKFIQCSLENKRIEFSLSASPYLKNFPATQQICTRKKSRKFKIFTFRSMAVGLLRSYIVSRNQKTENKTRKTPDLTAQKPADKMKKTKMKTTKAPIHNLYPSVPLTHVTSYLSI